MCFFGNIKVLTISSFLAHYIYISNCSRNSAEPVLGLTFAAKRRSCESADSQQNNSKAFKVQLKMKSPGFLRVGKLYHHPIHFYVPNTVLLSQRCES